MAGCFGLVPKTASAECLEALEGTRKIAGSNVDNIGKGPAVCKAVMPSHKMGHLMSDDDGQLVGVPLDGVQQTCTLQQGVSVEASYCSRESISRMKSR